jgi:hypothetical protein
MRATSEGQERSYVPSFRRKEESNPLEKSQDRPVCVPDDKTEIVLPIILDS